MAPDDLVEGVEYESQYGCTRRVILEILDDAFPEQSDPSTVRYQVTKSKIRRRGRRNGVGYVGCCTIDRFARWAYTRVG